MQTADSTKRFLDSLSAAGVHHVAQYFPEARQERVKRLMADIGRSLLIELAGTETYFPMRTAMADRNAAIRAAFRECGPGGEPPQSRSRMVQLARQFGLSERHVLRLLTAPSN